jgi:hypothetical protein
LALVAEGRTLLPARPDLEPLDAFCVTSLEEALADGLYHPALVRFMTIAGLAVLGLAFLCWIVFLANASSMHDSDPAGNALSQAFTFLVGTVLWLLLAAVLAIAVRGLPGWTVVVAVVLLPASGGSVLAVMQTLAGDRAADRWLLLVPFGVPLLVLGFALWALLPGLRGLLPSGLATGLAWGGVLLLAALPWPSLLAHRARVAEQRQRLGEQAEREETERQRLDREEWTARFEKLPADAPLWQWRDFTTHGPELRERALVAIRRLPDRQAQAEDLLVHGLDFPIRELPALDLEATPSLCEKARAFLREKLKQISPAVPGRPWNWENAAVDPYLPGIEWLLSNGCDCGREVSDLEAAVRLYPTDADRDRTLAALERLRGPSKRSESR